MFHAPPHLPIHECLDEIRQQLVQHDHIVLEAPPGAGKTTCVPLALLDCPWLNGQKIIMLEPRRVAALNAAHRLAALLGEDVGQTVGYRMRQATCVSAATRIEVITEGLLTRHLQEDPELTGIGAIIFDEFHERSIHSDTGLAMVLMARELFREGNPLKLIVMSATLEGEKLTRYLSQFGPCPQVTSQGRAFAVDIRYTPLASAHNKSSRFDEHALAKFIAEVLANHTGSVLVFLPGAGEINKTYSALKPLLANDCQLLTLHGNLKLAEQQLAIQPCHNGARKVVLATDIAETSLTIEGVRVVIDTGLARKPQFDPNTGLTRLTTEKIAKASAEQRAGRAGRMEPGVALRLWSEQEHLQRRDYSPPEITNADLMPLALGLLSFGCQSLDELEWLDRPSDANWQQAIDQLRALGALTPSDGDSTQLTPAGEQFAKLPCHPRLARLLLSGYELGISDIACNLAAILSEQTPSELGCDIHNHLNALSSPKAHLKPWQQRIKTLAKQFKSLLPKAAPAPSKFPLDSHDSIGVLIASGFPERIAQRKNTMGNDSLFKLANGRQAHIRSDEPLAHEPWLAIAEAGGFNGQQTDRIFSASALDPNHLQGPLKALCQIHNTTHWELASGRYICEELTTLGKLTLSKKPQTNIDTDKRSLALLQLITTQGLSLLHWSDKAQQLRTRMQFLHDTLAGDWPDASDAALRDQLEHWLLPALCNIKHLNELKTIELADYLIALLPWPLPAKLNELAPSSITIASGREVSIDYSQTPPVIAVKLQEMFGCRANPLVANGATKLNIHLLSPNGRPLAMTGDINFFWANAYTEVKKEMRGRYPKHPWPDDPINAIATAKTNRALRNS